MRLDDGGEDTGSDRRTLLRTGAVGAAMALLGPAVGRADAGATPVPVPVPAASSPAVPAFELDELTIADLSAGMASGKWTSRALAEKYLARIAQIDKSGPLINSIIEINPEALEIAGARDRERAAGAKLGPLHGIPVLLKDNIDTGDRMATSAGSLALAKITRQRDAHIVERLRAAGAVILGKTNLSEWANIRSMNSTSGWSARGGQTRNPYVIDRNPCGSSSGSGAAIAANLAAVAVGTETDGSIICPSSANSLVGMKPTLGLVSRTGIIPIAHSQDTAGPMARTVRDAAILLGVLAGGVDPRDAATGDPGRKAHDDYTRFLDAEALKGARLGVCRQAAGNHPKIDRLFERSLLEMQGHGAVLVDPVEITTLGQFDESELLVLLYELKADLDAYLAALPPGAPVHSLADVIRFNVANAATEMPWFGQDLFKLAQEKGPLTDKAYKDALAKNHRLSRAEGIDAVMAKHSLDALVAPSGGLPWLTDPVNGDHSTGGFAGPAAVAGYPHITVPAGYVYGLPVGLSFVGRAWAEPKLLALAYSFEQATRARQTPRFLPHADFAAL